MSFEGVRISKLFVPAGTPKRLQGVLHSLIARRVKFLLIGGLLKNKKASARPKDLADVALLTR